MMLATDAFPCASAFDRRLHLSDTSTRFGIRFRMREWFSRHRERGGDGNLIDHLLQRPNGIAVSILKLDPILDPLCKDPRFQALIDKYASDR
jgi:hypothetical protein